MGTAAVFALSLLMILGASELFTNAVEWAGFRMRLGHGATGSLLAAFGTSLPETVVPVVALLSATTDRNAIAMGAVLGAPFLLLGPGMAVTGIGVLLRRRDRVLSVDRRQARRDLGLFVPAYLVVVVAIAVPTQVRPVLGAGLLIAYALYVRATLRGGEPHEEMPEPLHVVRFWSGGPPHLLAMIAQLLASVALLALASELFVGALETVAGVVHLPALVVALVLVPVATELPETFNSLLWVRSRDDGLAFGNVVGSAVFQACILGWLGLTFTTWSPGPAGWLSGALTLVIGAYLWVIFRDGRARGWLLLGAALPWVGYVIAEIATQGRVGVGPK